MKKTLLTLAACSLSITFSLAQINLNDLGKKLENAASTATGGQTGLSNQDIISGLKEALTVGSKNSSEKASKLDGFMKNTKIKIPFPKEATEMESTLRSVGMGPEVDKFVLTLNRAAEDAAKEAAPIFRDAVTKMTISDGLGILKGADNAATSYLKNATSAELTAKFKPIIGASMNKVEVTRYWKPLATKYNKIPMARKVNPNLEEYVTKKAIEGLFVLVAEEEAKIRKDPAARVSDILKKVFGN